MEEQLNSLAGFHVVLHKIFRNVEISWCVLYTGTKDYLVLASRRKIALSRMEKTADDIGTFFPPPTTVFYIPLWWKSLPIPGARPFTFPPAKKVFSSRSETLLLSTMPEKSCPCSKPSCFRDQTFPACEGLSPVTYLHKQLEQSRRPGQVTKQPHRRILYACAWPYSNI